MEAYRRSQALAGALVGLSLLAPAAAWAQTADITLTNASATLTQTSDTAWLLEKVGALNGNTVSWVIGATEQATVPGQLMIVGQVTVTNSGAGAATLGNIVVNLQTREGKTWVTRSSNVANATDGDDATSAAIHKAASSEGFSAFSENSASGSLNFMDATNNTVFSLVPQVLIGPGQTRPLLFQAGFDNNSLGLAVNAAVRAEVIVTFGNSAGGNSTPNLDINGNGTVDADEARVRSVPARLGLKVPAVVNGNGSVVLTDTLDDITATGDVTFSNVSINLSATTGTVTATVAGGANGGSITNCAQLTSADQNVSVGGFTFPIVNGVDLQACSTVDVAGTPPNCTPGAPGCGWRAGEMLTAIQAAWGDRNTAAGTMLNQTFDSKYVFGLVVGGTRTITFTDSAGVFTYLPAAGPADSLTASVVDPLSTSSGELGGEVTALQLNHDYSALFNNAVPLATLRVCNYVLLPAINGQTVAQILATANHILGGGSATISASAAAHISRQINAAFAGGTPSTFAQENLVAAPSCGWQAGEMRTANQNSWGDDTSADGQTLLANFFSIYGGTSLLVGATNTMSFSSASAVINYLPAIGNAAALSGSLVNPIFSSAGEYGGQVVALELNASFSGVFGNSVALGDLRICNFAAVPSLNGQTVDQFLTTANWILGGGGADFGPSTASAVASLINNSFADGTPTAFAQASLVEGNCPAP